MVAILAFVLSLSASGLADETEAGSLMQATRTMGLQVASDGESEKDSFLAEDDEVKTSLFAKLKAHEERIRKLEASSVNPKPSFTEEGLKRFAKALTADGEPTVLTSLCTLS